MSTPSTPSIPSTSTPATPPAPAPKPARARAPKTHPAPTLGPHDALGAGDARLVLDLLPPDLAASAFARVKAEVRWAPMRHRGGEVPRRVAVEGEVGADGR